MLKRCHCVVAALAVVAMSGCGGNSTPAVHPVHGRVLFNGQPAANAQVTFHPVGAPDRKAVRAVGKVDEQGNFALTSYREGVGALAGEYHVTVVWYLARPVRPGSEETVSANYLPVRYASVETSQLSATINPGSNELPPFELK